jgi:SacI homology domain
MGQDVYHATNFEILPLNPNISVENPPHVVEANFLALLKSHFQSGSFLVSYNWDLTTRLQEQYQRAAQAEDKALYELVRTRFLDVSNTLTNLIPRRMTVSSGTASSKLVLLIPLLSPKNLLQCVPSSEHVVDNTDGTNSGPHTSCQSFMEVSIVSIQEVVTILMFSPSFRPEAHLPPWPPYATMPHQPSVSSSCRYPLPATWNRRRRKCGQLQRNRTDSLGRGLCCIRKSQCRLAIPVQIQLRSDSRQYPPVLGRNQHVEVQGRLADHGPAADGQYPWFERYDC